MKDLLESICILQEDGLEIGFAHRSFQEYFAAVYLVNMPQDKLKELLPQLARRGTDSVFTMMNDMNHDLFESSYVIPMINKTHRLTKALKDKPTAVEIALAYKLNGTDEMHRLAKERSWVSITSRLLAFCDEINSDPPDRPRESRS